MATTRTTDSIPEACASRACDPAQGSRLRAALVEQFRRPHGPLGVVAGLIMAHRPSNVRRSLETVRLLDVQPSDRVLEIGFGPGVALRTLAERAHEVHGLDHSPTMVAMARRRNRRAVARGRLRLWAGSLDDLSADAPAFDKVLAVNVFHFWSTPVEELRAVRARMRAGGRLAITHQPRNRGASAKDVAVGARRIVQAMNAAGFGEVTAHELRIAPSGAVCVVGSAGDWNRASSA